MRIKRGFTLVEILTVIAIVSILMALIFPAFVTARYKAREVTCISQMRQVVTALNIYRQDYDGGEAGNVYSGMGLPYPDFTRLHSTGYIKDDKLFYCPNRWLEPAYTLFSDGPSYFSYSTFPKINFGVEYSKDPNFPVMMCDYHDIRYWTNRKAYHPSDRKVLGIGLSGSLVSHLFTEFTAP
jgi:prepilin-type N-terminal cleavage/methylation domain-containing protein